MAIATHEPTVTTSPSGDLDELLWRAWKALTLPKGLRAEIIEGAIEVSPTGSRRHAMIANRLRRALDRHLETDVLSAFQDGNVLDGRKVYIPDLFVAPDDLDEAPDADGLGVDVSGVVLVAEVVSPGSEASDRDRRRKRRAYARAGIEIYVIIDDFDGSGTVTVLADPDFRKGDYGSTLHVEQGTPVAIPSGALKGFTIGPEITAR
ncbi:Uma2 family endonuclease [Embleya sp. NPDC020630]|uniref:Uma2 family endonuclease n=1 Tax=Embleya sp. NPDC020630 TaxID=3363979 RepID=UPI003795EE05